jgi:divalent metal cation (Fe/Co/Zn/Cd) transporter
VIGLLLGYVALRLTRRNRQQGLPVRYLDRLRDRLGGADGVQAVHRLEAVYLGPGEVLVAADVEMDPALSGPALTGALERIRADARRELPVIARLYLTPVPPDA